MLQEIDIEYKLYMEGEWFYLAEHAVDSTNFYIQKDVDGTFMYMFSSEINNDPLYEKDIINRNKEKYKAIYNAFMRGE